MLFFINFIYLPHLRDTITWTNKKEKKKEQNMVTVELMYNQASSKMKSLCARYTKCSDLGSSPIATKQEFELLPISLFSLRNKTCYFLHTKLRQARNTQELLSLNHQKGKIETDDSCNDCLKSASIHPQVIKISDHHLTKILVIPSLLNGES